MKDAVSTYADFDQAMANTAATAGASAEDYQKLEAAALEMLLRRLIAFIVGLARHIQIAG